MIMSGRRKGQESAAKIISAARKLFATKGYANASLDDIAALAGFTKGAVYHFFGSKEELLMSLLRDIEDRSIGRTSRELADMQGTAMDKLLRFKTLQAEWAGRNANDLAILVRMSIESANRKSAVREQVLHIYARMEQVLTGIVEEGKASGEFRADLPVHDVVTWMISVHDGNMLLWHRSGRDKDVGRRLTLASMQAARMAVCIGPMDMLGEHGEPVAAVEGAGGEASSE
ncbi:TetR/AcrR family transcriptional regulator [Xanthobacter pseudotagetidis]|uniref:TetR/AcrR family transcriptional regulator n=1 Tax=Xanthobacter pseudotagetidis TaxID=3119911 RepID=UPI00372BBE97